MKEHSSHQDAHVDSDHLHEENKLITQRRAKLDQLKEGGFSFPNDFRRSDFCNDLQMQYEKSTKQELEHTGRAAAVVGRVIRIRGPFIVIQDMSGDIQLYVDKKSLAEPVLEQIDLLDIGDILAADGVLSRSNKGDLYVAIKTCRILTKALRPLPDKHKGLVDTEVKYRQRYLDLIANEESRHRFEVRSRVVGFIRNFFTQRRFLEVETPMMQSIPGGANARPFVTHHNALDMTLFLRIAPELFLKRLVVGGFERVFEINRNFRNEGLSTRHNPEFTMLEFYWAYADYHDLMELTEVLLRDLTQDVLQAQSFIYQEKEIFVNKPFTRLTMLESIIQYGKNISRDDLINKDKLLAIFKREYFAINENVSVGQLQTELFEHWVEPQLIQPTFITEYPVEVSPLARRNTENPLVTDRFEFFIAGREIANGFSELNDADDQRERFQQQADQKTAGDNEAMFFDEDYITALEQGLPPTAGQGIGIDRLIMLLTDAASIRDVILFPLLR
ncbi:MAG: lysine--tRNA ligase [Pseudomonadota bacterium]